jgi:N-acetylneuraminate lyase
MNEIAGGAPVLPFYYYHIPALTGVDVDMIEFLGRGARSIPNLVGIKYTEPQVHEFQACIELEDGRFDVLWGTDEMLLSALVVGARGAIGSTYNIAAPLYMKLLEAFGAGKLEEAREWQARAATMIRSIAQFPFHPAMKAVINMIGLDCGPCRLPQPRLSDAEIDRLRTRLEEIGFFNWGRPESESQVVTEGSRS